VIGLPSNLFYGTGIPACVLVFNKCRKENENILFIDASREFLKGKNQNRLTTENIHKIFDTYKDRKEIKKYSHRAELNEIKENNYNLNIPRYVDTFEEEPEIDILAVAKEVKQLSKEEESLRNKIAKFCDELSIEKPF
jgi:type I restriction enzyme M protein